MSKESEDAGTEFRLYRDLVENMSVGIFLIRANDGIIVYANPAIERIFGYDSGEMTGRHISTVNAPTEKSPDEVAQEIMESIHASSGWQGDVKNIKKDGTAFWTHADVTTFEHPVHGEVWAATQQDITDRKQAEEALRASEEKYRTLAEVAQDMIYIIDADQRVIYTNHRSAEIFKMVPRPLDGISLTELFGAEVAQRLWKNIEKVFQGAETSSNESYLPLPEGHGIWVSALLAPIKDNAGHVTAVLGISRDITGRKQSEDQLRQAEANYRSIFENAIEGIFQSSPEGRFISVNAAMARIYGYESPDEMIASIGSHIGDRVYARPEHRTDFIRILGQTGIVKNFEAENLRKDGSVIWTRTNARIIRDAGGAVLYYEGFLVDITESKRAEEKLQKANETLQARLSEIQSLQETLREQATHDALTGLYNRRYLYDTVEREIARAKRDRYSISVMMIDIDHFKNFNDSYGHLAGDEVLKALGGLLHHSTRRGDIACRYGGEEFVILMPEMDAVNAERRAEMLRSDFNNLRIPYEGNEFSASISIGVAVYPAHGCSIEEIVKAADSAMYEAKQAGRNRVCIWKKQLTQAH